MVVIILQVVTMFMVASGNKGRVRAHHGHRRPDGATGGERKDGAHRRDIGGGSRKPGENRGGGNRPQQHGGSRPQQNQNQSAAAIDPMEKSLRDINLRLKNAEREQENARRKIQDGTGNIGGSRDGGSRDGFRDGRPQQRRDGGNRGERGERGERGDRSGRRDFNRDQRRDGRPERQDRGDESESAGEERPRPSFQVTDQPVAPEIFANEAGAAEELQHGRKFTAKRRQLPENSGMDETPEFAGDMPTPPLPATGETTQSAQAEQPQDASWDDIQFGRGRR